MGDGLGGGEMTYFAGVETGGTFTDVVILDAAGNVHFDKAFTTPHRPALGVIAALDPIRRR